MIKILALCTLFQALTVSAVESTLRGVVDLRASATSSSTSYLNAGYGKFGNDDGQSFSIDQLGLQHSLMFESGISSHLVLNAFQGKDDDKDELKAGVTEAYLKYRSLVNESGYRWQTKFGIFYPDISLENNAIAWASKYTLNSSMMNTWIGEEIRALGSEVSVTRLGRFNNVPYDLSFSMTGFINNDPAGSLISWHGWTQSHRQTFWTEKRELPSFLALRPGNALEGQAKSSDPFVEIDSRVGLYSKAEIKFHKKGLLSIGYYDNNATPYLVENGQYAWETRFLHVAGKWHLPYGIELSGQYMIGDTLMQNPDMMDIVNNDFHSGYVTLSKRWGKHRLTTRFEDFSVTDNDSTPGDDNNENGKAATLSYNYRIAKPTFISLEYNWIDSYRAARVYLNLPQQLIEKQWQIAVRYFY